MTGDEPAWGTPECRLRALQRVASTIPEAGEDSSHLTAAVSFLGDGDTVGEAEVFQKAADYFRAHPELTARTANWTTFTDPEGMARYALELTVSPPAYIDPSQARQMYPHAEH